MGLRRECVAIGRDATREALNWRVGGEDKTNDYSTQPKISGKESRTAIRFTTGGDLINPYTHNHGDLRNKENTKLVALEKDAYRGKVVRFAEGSRQASGVHDLEGVTFLLS